MLFIYIFFFNFSFYKKKKTFSPICCFQNIQSITYNLLFSMYFFFWIILHFSLRVSIYPFGNIHPAIFTLKLSFTHNLLSMHSQIQVMYKMFTSTKILINNIYYVYFYIIINISHSFSSLKKQKIIHLLIKCFTK